MTRLLASSTSLAFAFCCSLAARADGAGAPEDRGLCKKGEQVVFSCLMNNGEKTASICVAGKNLAYRYGKPEKVELEFPAKPRSGRRQLQVQA